MHKNIVNNHLIRLLSFLILLGLQPFTCPLFANDKILDVSQVNQDSIFLTNYCSVFEDASAKRTLADVITPDIAVQFQSNQKSAEAFSFGYKTSAYWLRMTLRNSTEKSVERMLEISDARLSHIQFYQPNLNHQYSVITTGLSFPFSTRPYKNHYFVFPIVIPAHSEQTYYLRIESKTTILIPLKLWETNAFHVHEQTYYHVQTWYFGMVSAMVIFNLLLFILLRDCIHLLYVASSFTIAVVSAGINGLFKEFIFPDSTFWIDKTVPYLTGIATVAFLFFMRNMLNTKIVIPKFDKLIQFTISLYLLILLGLTLIPLQMPTKPLVIIYFLTPFLVMAVCVKCVLKKQRRAYFFSIAFFIFIIGAAITQMRSASLLPTNIFTIYAIQIGSVLEMQLMAIALADRFNSMRKERENAQVELLETQQRLVDSLKESELILEKRVMERTLELQIANKKLAELSTTDALTGIANRRHFDSVLAIEWARAERQNQPLALAIIDVDWFKKYNDYYGHQHGDDCLKTVAQVLASTVSRKGDLVARYGGEEFVFIAPATDASTGLCIAQSVCQSLQKLALPHKLSDFHCVTVSIGVAAIIPSKAFDSSMLLEIADKALYHAKKHGRNQAFLGKIC